MGPGGFAAVPIPMLDPPRRAASPMVPALKGSGSPNVYQPEFGTGLALILSISEIF